MLATVAFNFGRTLSISAFIALSYCSAVMFFGISNVDSAKNLLAPPFTPSKLIFACSSIEGMFVAYSLFPDARLKTPAVPTSARVFAERFPLPRSLSPRRFAATSCLKY